MKKFSVILVALLIASHCFALPKDTIRVLFVGNSYTFTNNMPQIVSAISDSTHTKITTYKSTVGGALLSEHWRGSRGLKTKEKIANGHFDIVVFQQFSMGAIDFPDSTLFYGKLLCDYARQYGAKPYLFLTWARKKVPQFQEEIDKVYAQLAKETGAILVPVGKAWELAQQVRPTVELFSPDGSHPSDLGTFLSALIFVGKLTGELPKKLPQGYSVTDYTGESVNLMYLDNLDIEFCLRITKQILDEKKK